MDWSRAKNVIIAVLLAANIAMGAGLLRDYSRERLAMEREAEYTEAFLENQGLRLDFEIPKETQKLPVLFLSLRLSGEGDAEYKGIPLVVTGRESAWEVSGQGDQSAQVISASDALLRLYSQLSSEGYGLKGLEIEGMDMVYLLELSPGSYASRDTAVPAWRILCGGETYYIDAYGE